MNRLSSAEKKITGTAVVLLVLCFFFLQYCTGSDGENVILTISDEEAVHLSDQLLTELAPIITDDLDLSLWASENLVSDPVALYADYEGRVWITVTERRRNAELDIRGHSDWMTESVTLESVEDRRDFVRSQLSLERSQVNSSWLEDHNEDNIHDWRDLTVNQESVFLLEDLTDSGFANQARMFTRDFNDEITDVAGAVMYHDDDLFLGVSPDLWRIRDSTGDGYGDEKVSVSHGYGTNIGFAGHGMSGLTLGPDGRIYWSVGDVGMSVLDHEGDRWHYPRQGVIVRSEPDGSNFEVYASGFRNTHEFAFDKYGNLITVDNDGDHAGEFERLIYVVNGSDSGWRLNWQFGKYDDPKNNQYKVLMDEEYFRPRFENQAAHLLPPLAAYESGPAGMAYNPGTALGDRWKDYFFVAEFTGSANRSGIHAFTLKEDGASFVLDHDEQILQGVLATGMDFGSDGSLYFADWIEGWTLSQKGRIWKIDSGADKNSHVRIQTRELLSEDFGARSSPDLYRFLGHEDMRVRKKAQFEIAEREDHLYFQEALEQMDSRLARIHGIWGLAQMGRRQSEMVEPLIAYLDDEDPEIRAQAAKMLGDVRYEPAAYPLIPLLKDDHARVRFFAAEALGRMSWQPAMEPVVEMIRSNNDEDVYLRHGGAIALERIGDEVALEKLADDPSRAVRIAAVIALKRLESPGVVRFLKDEDEFIVTNAARAINDDSHIEEGLSALSSMLNQERFLNEPLLRRAINASLYSGTAEDAQRLAEFSIRSDIPEDMRVEALRALGVWPSPSILDRVTGDPRGKIENSLVDAQQAMDDVTTSIFSEGSGRMKIAAVETISSLGYLPATQDLLELLQEDPLPEVRTASLQALADIGYGAIEKAVLDALDDNERNVRIHALQTISDLNLSAESIVNLSGPVIENGSVEEIQISLRMLAEIDHPSSHEILEQHLNQLISGQLTREIQLDLILAIEQSGSEELKSRLEEYHSGKEGQDSVSEFSESLYGGDAEKGQRLFYQDTAAQCVRCHIIRGEGNQAGPDLTSVGNRLSREEILTSMTEPDARISPGFGTSTLTLHSDERISGILTAETETHVIIYSENEEREIAKADIAEQIHSISGMPAMGDILSRQDLRDLVEFLTTLQE